jgi:adenylate kinase family enzyme
MHRIVVMGNSGAGKSTLAARLARAYALAHLDLDTVAWEPGVAPPRRAPLATSAAALDAFTTAHPAWVIEGCYADLIALAAERSTLLVFLDPGVDACQAHCRARPWEPHKYATKDAQDANLPMLLAWVADYETRTDEFSRRRHQEVFAAFAGAKLLAADADDAVRAVGPARHVDEDRR